MSPLPLFEILADAPQRALKTYISPTIIFGPTLMAFSAIGVRNYCLTGKFASRYDTMPAAVKMNAILLRNIFWKESLPRALKG